MLYREDLLQKETFYQISIENKQIHKLEKHKIQRLAVKITQGSSGIILLIQLEKEMIQLDQFKIIPPEEEMIEVKKGSKQEELLLKTFQIDVETLRKEWN